MRFPKTLLAVAAVADITLTLAAIATPAFASRPRCPAVRATGIDVSAVDDAHGDARPDGIAIPPCALVRSSGEAIMCPAARAGDPPKLAGR